MPVKLKRLTHYLRREGPLAAVLPVVGVLVLAGLFLHTLNGRLRPVLEAVATSQAANLMTQAIAGAVDDCLQENHLEYGDFVSLERDGAGKVTSITSNTAANSRFKREVVEAVARQLAALDSESLGVPLGTLTGQPLLSGAGPRVRVSVDSVGEVTADYANSFTSAGVNQTLHRIWLEVDVPMTLLLPGGEVETALHTRLCVAETVIVGKVPDTYLQLGQQ